MTKTRILLLTLLIFTLLPFGNNAYSSDFKIMAGDVLQITVWKEAGMDHELVVLPDGSISFPLIGMINIQGLTPIETSKLIKNKLRQTIPDAAVSVIVKAPLGHTVNIIGQVTKPGKIVMGSRLTVMQALSQAGGLTPFADDGSINIIRKENGKEISIEFPYDDVSRGSDLEKNIELKSGDVIVVPTAGLF